MQKRLGRNTTTVQAGATEFVAFDESNAFAQLSTAKCCGITTAAATKNHDIKIVFGHYLLLQVGMGYLKITSSGAKALGYVGIQSCFYQRAAIWPQVALQLEPRFLPSLP